MRDVFIDVLSKSAATNPDIFLITGDLGFSVLDNFAEQFPQQFLNAGVAEQNMTALAAGIAHEGRNVFTYSIANFPTLRCLEQLRNDICYRNANVTVVSIGGGFSYGSLGPSHHATEDIAIMRALPEMLVLVPSDKRETAEATRLAISHEGPTYLRLDKTALDDATSGNSHVKGGKANLVADGDAATIFTAGGILRDVLEARSLLESQGYTLRIYTTPVISELDNNALVRACNETGGIITVEEHSLTGGLGGAIAERCMDLGLHPQCFLRIGLPAHFIIDVGTQDYMKKATSLDAASIASSVKTAISRN